MPLERPQLWVPWASFERNQKKEFSQVNARKWRDRYSAQRVRPAIRPYTDVEEITSLSWTTISDPDPVHIGIPAYADYLLARAQIKLNAGTNARCSAGFRVRVSGQTGTEVYISLDPDFDQGFTIYDGNVTDNDDTTWWDVTSIVPDPSVGPFDATDWGSLIHLLEIQAVRGVTNCVDVEVRTSHRQWTWIPADYLPTIPPLWVPSEYA
jgi:hypothetical protein